MEEEILRQKEIINEDKSLEDILNSLLKDNINDLLDKRSLDFQSEDEPQLKKEAKVDKTSTGNSFNH